MTELCPSPNVLNLKMTKGPPWMALSVSTCTKQSKLAVSYQLASSEVIPGAAVASQDLPIVLQAIDIIDYINGIGNCSCEPLTPIQALCALRVIVCDLGNAHARSKKHKTTNLPKNQANPRMKLSATFYPTEHINSRNITKHCQNNFSHKFIWKWQT